MGPDLSTAWTSTFEDSRHILPDSLCRAMLLGDLPCVAEGSQGICNKLQTHAQPSRQLHLCPRNVVGPFPIRCRFLRHALSVSKESATNRKHTPSSAANCIFAQEMLSDLFPFVADSFDTLSACPRYLQQAGNTRPAQPPTTASLPKKCCRAFPHSLQMADSFDTLSVCPRNLQQTGNTRPAQPPTASLPKKCCRAFSHSLQIPSTRCQRVQGICNKQETHAQLSRQLHLCPRNVVGPFPIRCRFLRHALSVSKESATNRKHTPSSAANCIFDQEMLSGLFPFVADSFDTLSACPRNLQKAGNTHPAQPPIASLPKKCRRAFSHSLQIRSTRSQRVQGICNKQETHAQLSRQPHLCPRNVVGPFPIRCRFVRHALSVQGICNKQETHALLSRQLHLCPRNVVGPFPIRCRFIRHALSVSKESATNRKHTPSSAANCIFDQEMLSGLFPFVADSFDTLSACPRNLQKTGNTHPAQPPIASLPKKCCRAFSHSLQLPSTRSQRVQGICNKQETHAQLSRQLHLCPRNVVGPFPIRCRFVRHALSVSKESATNRKHTPSSAANCIFDQEMLSGLSPFVADGRFLRHVVSMSKESATNRKHTPSSAANCIFAQEMLSGLFPFVADGRFLRHAVSVSKESATSRKHTPFSAANCIFAQEMLSGLFPFVADSFDTLSACPRNLQQTGNTRPAQPPTASLTKKCCRAFSHSLQIPSTRSQRVQGICNKQETHAQLSRQLHL